MKVYNEHEGIHVKSWCANIEDKAWEQVINLTELPFAFHHVALMPDCHLGYGMPIGGVLATQGVIIPNAVGMDIGCVDKETEFLSPNGWIKIDQYNGEDVMQFHPYNGTSEYVKPLAYIKEPCDEFIHFKTKYGIDQMLSKEHRCLIYKYDKSYMFNKYDTISAEEIYKIHSKNKNGFRHKFKTTFIPKIKTKIDLTDIELRLMVMICADGCISSNKVYLNFIKERKASRCMQLLKESNTGVENVKYKYNKETKVFTFSFYPPILKKGIHQFWKASLHQLNIIAEECLYWDGDRENTFYTRKKEEADFINYVFTCTGNRSTIHTDIRESGIDYRVFKIINTKIGINSTKKEKNVSIVKSEDGYKYCFTVPSSYLILRRNGRIFVTGNCGMLAVRTSLTEISHEDLELLVNKIKEFIPVGFNRHEGQCNKNLMPTNVRGKGIPNMTVCGREYQSARHQLGTLGGGNHFIEIQRGSDGHIWYMIHSGSRNLGYQVAKHYNNLAKELNAKWLSVVPCEHELAFLPIDTMEANTYIEEMNYCLEFAKANRNRMSKVIKDIFTYSLGDMIFNNGINIHHNYASLENHYGSNVWVHRKGATSARKGELGIIPGSQGTNSYIVEGRGSKESFLSCSHGAGRTMGRKQARNTLSLEHEQSMLDSLGVIHSISSKENLDEAPSAYKPIKEVMKAQEDLVKIVVELEPLAVVKG